MEKEIVEEEQEEDNQTTENLQLCSDVVLLILVILSLSICEAVSLLGHCRAAAAETMEQYLSIFLHSGIRKQEDSWIIPRQMSLTLTPCKSNDDY